MTGDKRLKEVEEMCVCTLLRSSGVFLVIVVQVMRTGRAVLFTQNTADCCLVLVHTYDGKSPGGKSSPRGRPRHFYRLILKSLLIKNVDQGAGNIISRRLKEDVCSSQVTQSSIKGALCSFMGIHLNQKIIKTDCFLSQQTK